MDLEWKETEMEALNLADNALKGLKPDPAWMCPASETWPAA